MKYVRQAVFETRSYDRCRYIVESGNIKKMINGKNLICIPERMQKEVVHQVDCSAWSKDC